MRGSADMNQAGQEPVRARNSRHSSARAARRIAGKSPQSRIRRQGIAPIEPPAKSRRNLRSFATIETWVTPFAPSQESIRANVSGRTKPPLVVGIAPSVTTSGSYFSFQTMRPRRASHAGSSAKSQPPCVCRRPCPVCGIAADPFPHQPGAIDPRKRAIRLRIAPVGQILQDRAMRSPCLRPKAMFRYRQLNTPAKIEGIRLGRDFRRCDLPFRGY